MNKKINLSLNKHLLVLFVIIFLCSFKISNAQWKYPSAKQLKSEVIINYEIIYERELTEKEKKSRTFSNEIVVIFNSSKLRTQQFYNDIKINTFGILDYDKSKAYSCNVSSPKSKFAISNDFRVHKETTKVDPKKTKAILGFECAKSTTSIKGIQKNLYYTQKLGLRYVRHFDVDGFLLEYPGYDKNLGHYKVVAKSIHYKKLDRSIFSLDEFRVYTNEEYKALKNKSTERYAKARLENIGKASKKFSTRSMKGKKLSSKDMKDEVIVLNFWFTTCPPCKKEIPALNKLKEAYKDQNVHFIAIATDPEYRLDAFLKEKKFNYDIVSEGRWIADKYGVSAYPTNIVIDKDGTIQLFEIGYKSDIIERMTYQIEKALK